MPAMGKFEQCEVEILKAYETALQSPAFNPKSESELFVEKLENDHLQMSAAKNILTAVGISVVETSNNTVSIRQKIKKYDPTTKEEKLFVLGPISLTEEQWVSLSYVINKNFKLSSKLEK